jgi:hypothetical protein
MGGNEGPTRSREPWRVPPVTAFLLGIAVGWIVGRFWGALLGGAIGFLLWRSRA